MKDNREVARGWFAKSHSDMKTAQLLLKSGGPFDGACFHCQQAVEKAFKGFLAFHDIAFPFTHDLEKLTPLCMSAAPGLILPTERIHKLTDYAVNLR